MSIQINRRDFIKLASFLPLLTTKYPKNFQFKKQISGKDQLPNILILVFDALSANHVSLFGYNRDTMPNLSRLSQRANVYHNYYAGGNFTSAGTASILTGTYPWTHRAFHLHGTVEENLVDHNIFNLLAEKGYTGMSYSHNLLATSLLYQFRAAIDNFKWTRELCLSDTQYSDIIFPNDFNHSFWSEWLIMRGGKTNPSSLFFSFAQRMLKASNKSLHNREYGDQFPRGIPNLHNLFFVLEDTTNWIMEQLTSLPEPYLSYIHVLPPHEPYTTRKDFINIFKDGWSPKPKPERFFSDGISVESLNHERRLYDEYIAYADAEIGRIFDFLHKEGITENTYIFLTSDHGELFERGVRGHVTPALYQPVINVPLLVWKPGQTIRKDIFEATSCTDILPTLAHIAGMSVPNWTEGEVLPSISEQTSDLVRDIYSVEAKSNPKHQPLNKMTVALIKGQYKLIYYTGYGQKIPQYELFDIENDPEEREDLSSTHKSVADGLYGIIREKITEVNRPFI
ncbi:sulfatase [Chloroflexota bacterium]